MTKWVCSVCGYVYEGENAPEVCPVCKAPADKFIKQGEEMTWAAEHVVGVAQGVSEDIIEDLRANFQKIIFCILDLVFQIRDENFGIYIDGDRA